MPKIKPYASKLEQEIISEKHEELKTAYGANMGINDFAKYIGKCRNTAIKYLADVPYTQKGRPKIYSTLDVARMMSKHRKGI